ncbi:unnamed protein product [Ectocarpus fasciculatus]
MGKKNVPLLLVLTLSCSESGLSFLRPQISSLPHLSQAPAAKTSVTRRQAATTIPGGGVPSGKLERGAPASKTSADQSPFPNQSPPPPPQSVNPAEVTPGATAVTGGSATQVKGKDASGTPKTAVAGKVTAASKGGVGPSAAVSTKAAVTAAPPGTTAGSAAAVGGAPAAKAGGAAVAAVEKKTSASAKEREAVTATDKRTEDQKKALKAGPETTAAEKVLTLVEIGLVDKEEASAYYEALSDLERTTQEAKVAAAAAAEGQPSAARSSSATPFSPQEGPLSLVPFPAVCAALGAAGTHSLHLAGGLGTAFSVFGAVAGVALGGLVVIGDDPLGRAARAAGLALARSAGAAGVAAGKSVSESAAGAAGAAVGAVEEAVIKAPANFLAGVASSISSAVSAAVGSVTALPGAVVTKAADGAKGALQDTSDAVVNMPGEVARKAAQAAGGALQSTSDAAVTAVRESPKRAAKSLNDAVSSPGKTLTAFANGASSLVAQQIESSKKKARPAAPAASTKNEKAPQASTAATSVQEKQEPDGIPIDELEAKMSSVRKALERFDTVKSRIEEANTSDTMRETVSMTRGMDMSAEREKGEEARAAAKRPDEARVNGIKEGTPARPGGELPSVASTTTTTTTKAPKPKPMDQERRKQVAEELLEKASQRATEAKAGLKAAAASSRREAENTQAKASLTATPVGGGADKKDKKAPQETVATL